jgi:hypothetical protein
MIDIQCVDSNNLREIRKFVRFPFDLYRKTPQWVPPIIADLEGALRREHPFFQHSEADFFLANRDGAAVGCIAVMNNRRANAFRGEKTAFFGFFEAIDDPKVSAALFETAFEWAKAHDLNRIIGPRGLIGSDSSGILVDGFDHPPALNVPYNLPYYDRFIRQAGFEKDTDHLSGYLPGNHTIPERIQRIAQKIRKRRGYEVKSFTNKEEMKAWVPKVQQAHRKAFENTYTFYPPTDAEMESIAGTLISIAHPSLVKLLLKDQEVIGFIFAYHDISAALRKSRGRIWPLGWMHILLERARRNWVNINGVGLLPEHQGLGGNTLLYTEIDRSIKALGFKHIDIVQVNEKNFTSFNDMEAIGVQWCKRHRSYYRYL